METQAEPADFWRNHSLAFLEMAFRNDCRQRISTPDGYGKKSGDCGDTVEFFMKLNGEAIAALCYDIDGCLNTNACCNAVIELVAGRTVAAAWEVTPEQVAELLETLPPDHLHCAELVVGTLYLTLSDAREKLRHPWKKKYG